MVGVARAPSHTLESKVMTMTSLETDGGLRVVRRDAPEWDDERRAWNLTVDQQPEAIVVTHSQSGIMGHHMTRILKEHGNLGMLKGLITLEGSCSLTNSGLTAADFDNVPYMALKGDYTNISTQCQEIGRASCRERV